MLKEQENFIVDREKSGRGRYQLDGKPLTGVTTICNMQAKGFLVTWAATEAYKDCLTLTDEEIKLVLKNKSYAHTKKGDSAKGKGTEAHDYVEKFVRNFIETKQYNREVIQDEEIANSVYRFYDWAEKNKVEFIGCEESVYSRVHWFAGSFDFICKINGKTLLGDFKTSKQIDDTYFAQGAGYVIALEETNPDVKFDGIIIVRSILAKEGQTWYEKSSNGKAKKMTNEAFGVAISYNLEREKAYFLSLLSLYKYSKGLEIKRWKSSLEVEIPVYNENDFPLE